MKSDEALIGVTGSTSIVGSKVDRFNFLFPAFSGIGLWAIAAGIWLVLRARATSPATTANQGVVKA